MEDKIDRQPEGESAIEIEQMLFGDFRVCVWDENLSGMLDKEYFCRGYESALATALLVQKDMFPNVKIYIRSGYTFKELEQ